MKICPNCKTEGESNFCPNCGTVMNEYALESEQTNPTVNVNTLKASFKNDKKKKVNTKSKKKFKEKFKNLKLWQKILLIIVSIVLILAIVFWIAVCVIYGKYNKSFNNISPYLNYVGVEKDNSLSHVLSEELYDNMENVEFWGKKGIISYEEHEGYLVSCTWSSFDFVSEDEYRKFAEDLYYYFDEEPEIEPEEHFDGNTYEYCYTDQAYNFSVRVGHDLFNYDPNGQIDIRWSASDDQLKRSDEEVIEEEPEEEYIEKRAEASDYDEFKHAMDVCLLEIPNCYLDLDYTDEDNSYSISMADEIVGIFGVEIDSWDAVALTDPNKEDAELYHEQVSIALIMACDSDISYEQAKEIFEEASEEDSASVSAGIWCFEGMDSGMLAFGVDITWLD